MFSERRITNTCGLLSLQNTQKEANLPLPFDVQMQKNFQLQGALPLTCVATPGPCWGSAPNPNYRLTFTPSSQKTSR